MATASSSAKGKSTSKKDSDVLEAEKRHHKPTPPHENAPGWNEELATESEAHVKADQAPGTPSDLQARTVEHVRTQLTEEAVTINEEKEATSTTAFYERDEVTGPLKGAEGKEDLLAGYNNAPTTKKEVEGVRKTKKKGQEARGA